MADDDIFAGLPPPSAPESRKSPPPPSPAPAPAPALKSALKRTKPPPSDSAKEAAKAAPSPPKSALKRSKPSFADPPSSDANEEGGKRLRFRTTVDASDTQIKEAMQKITSHIKNPSKFGKASKLALQLIQAGSVKEETSDQFYALLEAAMMQSLSTCNEPPVRADYRELFAAAQDASEHFNKKQKNQLVIWKLHAVVANDLHTDDSFVFSKTVTIIKEAISNLPIATADDDKEESESLSATENAVSGKGTEIKEENNAIADPFGLDDLFANKSKKHDKSRGKEASDLNKRDDEDELKRFMKLQREALLKCLEIAAKRYRIPWTQTSIDILVKHAFDNVQRFTRQQREAIGKLWGSIKEQQTRRRQGKSVTGKLDVNAFEWLQEKYATQKISIRHAVGGGGDRRCEQWLG